MTKEKLEVPKEEVGTGQKESELNVLDMSSQVPHVTMLHRKCEEPKESR